MPQTKAELLKNTDIFRDLSEAELSIIAESCGFENFNSGETVFSKGDPGQALYIVVSGEIAVRKQDEYDPAVEIARFIRGNVFGELDLFTESARTADALARTDSRLLVFPSGDLSFDEMLSVHPRIWARILHKLLGIISERIRNANSLIKENSPVIRELRKQVYRDKLTGIHNQTFLMEKLWKIVKKEDSRFALIIGKPDNFKELNDSLGHEAGDKAIRILARRLRDFIGDDDRVVRYKGNAMAVLLENSGRDEALTLAETVREFIGNLDLSDLTGHKDFKLSSSLGICLCPDHGRNPDLLASEAHELPLIGRAAGGSLILFPEDAEALKKGEDK